MKAVIGKRYGGQPVRIPSSKSLSHRALISASLAEGTSLIRRLVKNQDTEATMRALRSIGVEFEETENGELTVHGVGRPSSCRKTIVDCSESGSTLRFLIPLFSLCENEVVFTGHGKLMSRPQTVYEELFRKQGLLFEKEGDLLRIKGPVQSGSYEIPGNISSQFITGLLFTLPLLNGRSDIRILPPYESKSYVGLTEDVLEEAGIRFLDQGETITVEGGNTYQPINLEIDGDDSQAAFFAELAMTSGNPVTVHGMRHNSRQGDHVIISLFEKAGGRSIPVENGYRFEPGHQTGFEADLSDCPDLGPALFAMAAACGEESRFTGCQRLRIKESDRIEAMRQELETLGASVRTEKDTVFIRGGTPLTGGTVQGHNDHRIVMALSALSPVCEAPLVIEGAEAVNKSYPDFFKDLQLAGSEVTTE